MVQKNSGVHEEKDVAGLYQDSHVAESYCSQRFTHSWGRLLHDTQVATVNQVIRDVRPEMLVEVAPGPARLTKEIRGIQRGVMIEYSEEMLAVARKRLQEAGLEVIWDIRHGNAFELETQNIQCDMLYTFRFIRHFYEDDRMRLYQQIYGCLKPGGYFIFDVVNRDVRAAIDVRQTQKSEKELDVYDVSYHPDEFRREMEGQGFKVKSLIPVVQHFDIQTWLSSRLDHRIPWLARRIVTALEGVPSESPLEWIAICQRNEDFSL